MATKGGDTRKTRKNPGPPNVEDGKPRSATAGNPKQPDPGDGGKAPGSRTESVIVNPPKTPY